MNIGLLWCNANSVCDGFLPKFNANLVKSLSQVDQSLHFTVYDLISHHFPTGVHENDAYVISGSRFGVYDQFDWIKKLSDFILELDGVKKKTIGVCFGHQIMAQSLGGKVERNQSGWGIGVMQHQIYHPQTWMNPEKIKILTLVSHQDQVVQKPKRARLVAGSDFCPYYWLSVEQHFTSLQGHPEFTKKISKSSMKEKKTIPQERKIKALESLKLKPDSRLINQWLVQFLRED